MIGTYPVALTDNPKMVALIFGIIYLAEFYFFSKWIKKYLKNVDMDILELLDDPKQYLEFITPFSPEESKMQYCSVIDRIRSEIQEKDPEGAKKLKKETLKYYLQQIGSLKEKPSIAKFLRENFWPSPTQNKRIEYVKNRIQELGEKFTLLSE